MSTGLITTTVLAVVACTEAKIVSNHYDAQNHFVAAAPLNMKPVIGGFALGLLLFAFDAVSPTVTKYLAILILVAALSINGQYLLNFFPKG